MERVRRKKPKPTKPVKKPPKPFVKPMVKPVIPVIPNAIPVIPVKEDDVDDNPMPTRTTTANSDTKKQFSGRDLFYISIVLFLAFYLGSGYVFKHFENPSRGGFLPKKVGVEIELGGVSIEIKGESTFQKWTSHVRANLATEPPKGKHKWCVYSELYYRGCSKLFTLKEGENPWVSITVERLSHTDYWKTPEDVVLELRDENQVVVLKEKYTFGSDIAVDLLRRTRWGSGSNKCIISTFGFEGQGLVNVVKRVEKMKDSSVVLGEVHPDNILRVDVSDVSWMLLSWKQNYVDYHEYWTHPILPEGQEDPKFDLLHELRDRQWSMCRNYTQWCAKGLKTGLSREYFLENFKDAPDNPESVSHAMLFALSFDAITQNVDKKLQEIKSITKGTINYIAAKLFAEGYRMTPFLVVTSNKQLTDNEKESVYNDGIVENSRVFFINLEEDDSSFESKELTPNDRELIGMLFRTLKTCEANQKILLEGENLVK